MQTSLGNPRCQTCLLRDDVVKFGDPRKYSVFLFLMSVHPPLSHSGLRDLECSVDILRTSKNNFTFHHRVIFKVHNEKLDGFWFIERSQKEQWGKGLTRVEI